jgi:hypothetical protein
MPGANDESNEEESKPFVLILTEPILNFLASRNQTNQIDQDYGGQEMKLK